MTDAGNFVSATAGPSDDTRRWVISVSATALAAYCLWILVRELNADRAWIIAEYVALPGTLAALLIAWRGHARLGAGVLLATVAFQEHFAFVLSRSPLLNLGTPVLPVLVAGTGLLLGARAAWVLSGAMVLSVPAATALGTRLFGPSQPIAGLSDFYAFVLLDLTNLSAAVVAALGAGALRRARQAAGRAEGRLAALVRQDPSGILLLDSSGRIVSLNAAAASVLGVRSSDAAGRPFTDTIGAATDPPHTTFPLPDEATPMETDLVLQGASGRRVVEASASRIPGTDDAGDVLVILRDVTEYRDAARRADQFSRLLERAPTEAYIVDSETRRIRFANEAARRNLGYTARELDGLTITDVEPGLTRSSLQRLETDLRRHPEGTVMLTGEHRRKDGTTYLVEMQAHLVALGAEPALGVLAVGVVPGTGGAPGSRRDA